MTCKDCKKFKNQRTLGTCQEGITVSENPVCSNFEEKPKTIFDQITEFLEVLAPHLVYQGLDGDFHSSIIEGGTRAFPYEDEAIVATVAKLKEPASDDYAGSRVEQ